MSTDYYIVCDKCQKKVWSFSAQAWGWGNVNPIETFKFMMHHTSKHGSACIRIEIEQSYAEDYESEKFNEDAEDISLGGFVQDAIIYAIDKGINLTEIIKVFEKKDKKVE